VVREWPVEALAFEESVEAALRSAGGIELARQCEADPTVRANRLAAVVESLGFGEIDLADPVQLGAAALGVRAAGRVVAPWPLVEQLAAPAGTGAVYLFGGEPRRAPHLDLVGSAVGIDVADGEAYALLAEGPLDHMPLDPFAVPCRRGEKLADGLGLGDALAVHIVLTGFWVLGALETAVALAAEYSGEREQFGRPIVSFGAIQWRLSDLAVSGSALAELAAFTLAKLLDATVTRADLFSLRLQMLESAKATLADAHQVFGAIGLCEEHDLAVIDRHLQSALRRPAGSERTGLLLADRVRAEGYDSLYPVGPTVAAETTNR
jgi:hypothetical protein